MHFEEYADTIPQILLFLLAIVVIIQLNQPLGAYEPAEETVDITEAIETYWEPVVETETEAETETETGTETEYTEEDYYDDLELMAYCVMAETGGCEYQPAEGVRLVCDVILNRVDNKAYFPNTVHDVIYAPGQFAVVANGSLYKHEPTEEIYTIIAEEIENRTNTEVYFFTAGGYNPSGEPWKKVGDHYFSKLRKELQ